VCHIQHSALPTASTKNMNLPIAYYKTAHKIGTPSAHVGSMRDITNLCPIRNGLVSGAGAVSVTYAAAATAATRRGKWEGESNGAALRSTGARKHRVIELAWPETLN